MGTESFVSTCSCCKPGKRSDSFVHRTLEGISSFVRWGLFADEAGRKTGLLQVLDPRVKLIGLAGWLVLTTLATRFSTLCVLYGLTLVLAAASRIPLGRFLLRTWIFIPLFSGVMALPAFLNVVTPGDSLVTVWSFDRPFSLWLWHIPQVICVTCQGVGTAAILVLRTATAVSWTVLAVLTTPWNKILAALTVLKVPHGVILIFHLAVRYLHVMVRQVQETHMAIHSRSMHPARSSAGRRLAASRVGVLFKKSLHMGESVYLAMVSRGYSGEVRLADNFKLRFVDYGWTAFCIAGMVFFWS